MRRGLWSLLIAVAVFGLVLLVLPLRSPPGTDSVACAAPVVLPARPSAAPGSLIAQATSLATAGRLDIAEELYRKQLEVQPPDTAGIGAGLAYVEARRSAAQEVVESAVRLAAVGNDQSRDCFFAALRLDRGNEEARAATRPDHRTLAERAADGWDTFHSRWLGPLTRAALPALAVLAVLLVLARLMTPVVVPAESKAWAPWVARSAWWAGLVLLAVVALRTTAFRRWPDPPLERVSPGLRLPTVLLALLLAALVVWLARHAQQIGEERGKPSSLLRTPWGVGVVLVLLIIVVAVGAPDVQLFSRNTSDRLWPWLLSAVLGVVGTALFAAGRGHPLRLQVKVLDGEKADPVSAAYVLARLQDLGSSPPRGVKTPQQVDVMDLPEDALKSLPAGRIASALAPLIAVLSTTSPWHVTVEKRGAGRCVVTVTRNGRPLRTATVDASQLRPRLPDRPPAAGAGGVPKGQEPSASPLTGDDSLFTAAAAVILTELARVHAHLRVGLCGATKWESVAAHVVATTPTEPQLPMDLRRQMLAFAVQRDPCNALAWAAYVQLMGRDAVGAAELAEHASRLESLAEAIDRQSKGDSSGESGYRPLQLRTLHSVTAAWLNLALAQGALSTGTAVGTDGTPTWHASWVNAEVALKKLVAQLRGASTDPDLKPFVRQLWGVAEELWLALEEIEPSDRQMAKLERPPAIEDSCAPELFVLYDKACTAAVQGQKRGSASLLDEAIGHLRLATGLPELQDIARRDPALADLRSRGSGSHARLERFWAVVGDGAPLLFTDLPPFGETGPALRALGLHTAADIIEATNGEGRVKELCDVLEVPPSVVGRWRSFAELSRRRGARGDGLDPRQLRLLLDLGIRAPEHLPFPPVPPAVFEALLEHLNAAAKKLGVRPVSPEELAEVLG